MPTIDMTLSGTGERVPNYLKANTYTREIDFAKALIANDGTALAAADVIQVFTVPAGCVVECACISPVEVVNAEATVCILDLGDAAAGAAVYVDGFDAEATTEGVPVMTVEKFYPVADTIDLTIQALTGTLTTGKVKISIRCFELTV